ADRPAVDEPRLRGEGADRPVRGEGRLLLAVAALVGVADDAVLRLVAAAAVEARRVLGLAQARHAAELAVARLAVRDRDDLAREVARGDLVAGGRDEVVDRVGRMPGRDRRDCRGGARGGVAARR